MKTQIRIATLAALVATFTLAGCAGTEARHDNRVERRDTRQDYRVDRRDNRQDNRVERRDARHDGY